MPRAIGQSLLSYPGLYSGVFCLQMVFLPEACDYIADSKEQSVDMAERLDGDLVSRYRDAARQHQLWLSIGGFHQKVAATVYGFFNNSCHLS